MEYIKLYSDLDDKEKDEAYKFANSKDRSIDSLQKLDERFNAKIYDYGEGALFYFNNDKVIAKICVVLEVVKQIGSAYIHNLQYDSGISDKLNKIELLIKEAKNIAKSKGARDIKLGINSQEVSEEELSKLNINIEYRALEMILKDKNRKFESLNLKELTALNQEKYIEIYNNSFRDMHHGTIIDEEYLNERLEKLKEFGDSNFYYIVCDDSKEIGIMEVTIEENKGLFDIGLCKEYRGKGYGKRLLETAVQFVVEKKVEDVSFIVIEKNEVAYNMYKKRGFEISKVIGHWSILK